MKRRYTIQIDVRDFQSLEHYQMGLEDESMRNPNEVTDIVRDVLWQIVQAEKDRIAENGK